MLDNRAAAALAPAPVLSPEPPIPTSPTVYISFCADVNPGSAEALIATAANLANQGARHVGLLLSTPGGSVMHGITIYNVLRMLPFRLTTFNVGSVNSIGNVLYLAGDERYCVPHATFMFHGVGFDVTQPVRMEEKLLLERLDSIRADQRKIATIIRDRTTFPRVEEIDELFLQAATKDADFARSRGIVHDARELKLSPGTPVHQLVFKR